MENIEALSNGVYTVECEIGKGGCGAVYKARHNRLNKYVVIKELFADGRQNINVKQNEAQALKNVKSAHLPQVFDCIQGTEHCYTVMEFIEGNNFEDLLKRTGRFSQQYVIKWYAQLAQALVEIHSKKVAHRDIKPANIILQPNGDVCLIDFNAALVESNNAHIVSVTYGYSSPEQLNFFEETYDRRLPQTSNIPRPRPVEEPDRNRLSQMYYNIAQQRSEVRTNPSSYGNNSVPFDPEQTVVSSRTPEQMRYPYQQRGSAAMPMPQAEGIDWILSDIFSLGASIYHILTGIAPSKDAHRNIPVSKLNLNISEGLAYVIDKSMSFDPAERFSSAEELLAAINSIYKFDKRWKSTQIKKVALAAVLPITFALFASCAVLGGRMMYNDKQTDYLNKLELIRSGVDVYTNFDAAEKMFPERIGSYGAMAQYLWKNSGVEECKSFITEHFPNILNYAQKTEDYETLSELYNILGNCYYSGDTPDYKAAEECFAKAVEQTKTNPFYYRDHALSLARLGQTSQASSELEKARVLNLDAASADLVRGEIECSNGNIEQADKYFEKAISEADSDEVIWRCYCARDALFKNDGEKSVAMWVEAKNKLSQSYNVLYLEKLANAYIRANQNQKAIEVLSELVDSSMPKLNTMINLAVLYQNEKQTDKAELTMQKAAGLYPNSYAVPAQQAILECYKMAQTDLEQRDYTRALEYYKKAKDLYRVSGEQNDPEMTQLEQIFSELRTAGWIKEN